MQNRIRLNSKTIGKLGEKIAETFLKRKGYKIIDKNYISRKVSGPQRGEIDIIAEKDNVISFVEVKTLSGIKNLFLPENKVDFRKRKKIIKMAEEWFIEKRLSMDRPWQIDVVAIEIDFSTKKAKIKHFTGV